jgi:hypothetical protein
MQRGLNSVEVKQNFFLELSFPRGQARQLPIKNQIIAFVPDAPSTNHHHLHEKW